MPDIEGSSPSEGSEGTVPGASDADVAETGSKTTPEPNQDANNSPEASSPSDGTDANEPTLLEAVEQALEKPDEGAAAPSPAESDQDTAKADTGAEDAPQDKAEDGDAEEQPPFHEHPRWKQLVSERDDLKAKLEEFTEAGGAIDRLESFLTQQNLSVDEFNNLLVIGGLVKNDPAKALEALTPIYQRVQQSAGVVLSQDLQAAVDQGFVTEDYARQLSQAQAQANQAQFHAQVATQNAQTEQKTALVNALSNEATSWETEWKASDPDYSKKADLVREKVELAVFRGDEVGTPEQVRAVCEKAKQEVEATLRATLPKKTEIKSNTPSSTTGGGSAASKPTTLMEAMRHSLEATV